MKERLESYEDIIELPHHQSSRRPHMPLNERAAQFSPFAALSGYEAAITEAGRLTESFRELDENEKAALDEMLQYLQKNKAARPEIVISHFVPDEVKEGGAYVETEGRFLKLLAAGREIVLETGDGIEGEQSRISLDRIAGIWLRH
jgi:hypothetical protein